MSYFARITDMSTMKSLTAIDKLIRSRRSVYPRMYTGEEITREEIMEILETAHHAPTHKLTQPWRFRVMQGAALERLGQFLADSYRQRTPEALFSDAKYEKMQRKPVQSAYVIAIYMQRDPEERLPEWEEIAAVSAAVQNMWLSCSARGIGAYWSTPSAFVSAKDFFQMEEGERCLGLFYMGRWKEIDLPVKRDPIESKVSWHSS